MSIKKAVRYNYQTSYKDYCNDVSNPLPWPDYVFVILGWTTNINRAIFKDGYEWKIPFFGGYLRISKTERGWFYWKWDKQKNSMHLPKAGMWSFEPVEGKDRDLGEYGLHAYYTKCKNDPKMPPYDVVVKKRKRIGVPFGEFLKSLK